MGTLKIAFRNLLYSFPLQLFLLHIKKHPILLLFWLSLIAVSSGSFAVAYGAPYLFLDPEYMGEVSYLSFLILGFAIGGFIMTWNTCFYMLNSFRFKFLVSLARPFVAFCYNNFIFPLVFNVVYIVNLIQFLNAQHASPKTIFIYVASFISGQLLMVLVVVIYFTLFNKNVEHFVRGLTDNTKKKFAENNIFLDKLDPDRPINDASQWPVETYLSGLLRMRYVRNVDHYDMSLVRKVLRQHHLNTLLIIVLCFTIIFAYGILLDNSAFRIPAGAAVMLIFSVAMAIACVISYWAGGWRVLVFVFLIWIVNYISSFDLLMYKHRLSGLDNVVVKKEYNNQSILDNIPKEDVRTDIRNTQRTLSTWYKKIRKNERGKPIMIFLQSSGGGLRASYWGMHVLQELEKATQGKLMQHTVMMSGASGGMIGSAYFRQLYFLQQKGKNIDPLDPKYREDMGKDILNAIFSGIATNDLIFPWQSFKKYGRWNKKDRAYWFDKQMMENTNGLIAGSIEQYKDAEIDADIPMMVVSPTIVNDQRVLLISATPVSYLCFPYTGSNTGTLSYLMPDGVEYMRFFEGQGAENITLSEAVRLNATYPYVLPTVYLPTHPEMKIMDAGLKENHGFGMSTRFINVFRRWIEKNTSGVVFIQIRSDKKLKKMDDSKETPSMLNEIFLPFGNIYSNFLTQQDYSDDMLVAELANSLNVPVSILPFIYLPFDENKEASMSFHLTQREKYDIVQAYKSEYNQSMEAKLKALLKVK